MAKRKKYNKDQGFKPILEMIDIAIGNKKVPHNKFIFDLEKEEITQIDFAPGKKPKKSPPKK